jgi:sec-independent protein translocase protein TatA
MMPFAFFNLHGPELLIVAFVALLIFGNRLPGVMRSLGKSVTEFKKGVSGIEEQINEAGSVPTPAAPPEPKPATTTTTNP